jgi:hypothetical protein
MEGSLFDAYSQAGGQAAAEMLLTCDPQFSISSRLPPYRDPDFQQRYHAALKAAGLRE